MFVPGLIQGRWLGTEDLEALRGLIAKHPDWSRRRLSIALCEVLNWRTASGQLKDMSARLLLNKLADRGFIELPPRQRGGGRRVLRALWEPELFTLSAGGGNLIQGPLGTLQPLEVIAVEPSSSHRDGPTLLNVLRVLDVPEAFGMLAPRSLTLVNAGHPSPLIYRRATRTVEEATANAVVGLPLGVFDGVQYTSCHVFLQPGGVVGTRLPVPVKVRLLMVKS